MADDRFSRSSKSDSDEEQPEPTGDEQDAEDDRVFYTGQQVKITCQELLYEHGGNVFVEFSAGTGIFTQVAMDAGFKCVVFANNAAHLTYLQTRFRAWLVDEIKTNNVNVTPSNILDLVNECMPPRLAWYNEQRGSDKRTGTIDTTPDSKRAKTDRA